MRLVAHRRLDRLPLATPANARVALHSHPKVLTTLPVDLSIRPARAAVHPCSLIFSRYLTIPTHPPPSLQPPAEDSPHRQPCRPQPTPTDEVEHRGGAQFPGMVITYAQMERLEDLFQSNPERVQIKKKARVTKLIKEGEAVVGVEYSHDGQIHTAHGPVVIATGGYAADFTEDSLLKKYRPEFVGLPTTNGDHCTGDGQKLAMSVGANGINLEKVQAHSSGLVDFNDPDVKVKFLAAEAHRGVEGLLLEYED